MMKFKIKAEEVKGWWIPFNGINNNLLPKEDQLFKANPLLLLILTKVQKLHNNWEIKVNQWQVYSVTIMMQRVNLEIGILCLLTQTDQELGLMIKLEMKDQRVGKDKIKWMTFWNGHKRRK